MQCLLIKIVADIWPQSAGAKVKCRDRVLGKGEKDSFITLPGKGGHSKLKMVPPLEGARGWFYSLESGIGIRAVDKEQGRGKLALFLKAAV